MPTPTTKTRILPILTKLQRRLEKFGTEFNAFFEETENYEKLH